MASRRQFSLRSLLLFVMATGFALPLVLDPQSWRLTEEMTADEAEARHGKLFLENRIQHEWDNRFLSSDGWKTGTGAGMLNLSIYRRKFTELQKLYIGPFLDATFLDEDTIMLLYAPLPPGPENPLRVKKFSRRFPERWWGHLLRWQLWFALATLAASVYLHFGRKVK